MDLNILSPIAKLLVAAAVAFVVTDLVMNPWFVRYLFGRWAVTRWLLKGVGWNRGEQAWKGDFAKVVRLLRSVLFPWWQLSRGAGWVESRRRRRAEKLTRRDEEERWRAEPAKPPRPGKGQRRDANPERALIRLACRDDWALYRMSPDLIAAQINAAATMALDCPKDNLLLLFALAGQRIDRAMESRIAKVHQSKSGPESVESIDAADPDLATALLSYGCMPLFRETVMKNDWQKPQILELRSRIETAIQQRIDAFQVGARFAVQVRDQAVYVVMGTIAMRLIDQQFLSGHWSYGVQGGVVAAFLAPYFGDLRTFLRQPR
jgi:hypothetical protein